MWAFVVGGLIQNCILFIIKIFGLSFKKSLCKQICILSLDKRTIGWTNMLFFSPQLPKTPELNQHPMVATDSSQVPSNKYSPAPLRLSLFYSHC